LKRIAGIITTFFLLTAVCITNCSAENIYQIQDVKRGSWYFTAVDYVVSNELMSSDADGFFKPDDPMLRKDLLTALYKMAGSPETENENYSNDELLPDWIIPAEIWAEDSGIVSHGDLRPDEAVVRQELAEMMYLFALSQGQFGVYNNLNNKDLEEFPDAQDISPKMKRAVVWMVVNGLMTGNSEGNIRPLEYATRAETALFLARMEDLVLNPGSVDWTVVKSVSHAGYNTIAPIDTIPAYQKSIEYGFEYAETDVRLTSDRVPVLLHNDTINQTARHEDGSLLNRQIAISEITYEEVLQYDFGIWMGEEYAGTKIATFDEFIDFCRDTGLKPYIELKSETGLTFEDLQKLIDKVQADNMLDRVTWISYTVDYLEYVKNCYSQARLGIVVDFMSTKAIEQAKALQNGRNEVFIDSLQFDEESCRLCEANGIPLEAWVVDDEETIRNMDPYVSGITSNTIVAESIFPEMEKSEAVAESGTRLILSIAAIVCLGLLVLLLMRFPPQRDRSRMVNLKSLIRKIRDRIRRKGPPRSGGSRIRKIGAKARNSENKVKNEVFENPYL